MKIIIYLPLMGGGKLWLNLEHLVCIRSLGDDPDACMVQVTGNLEYEVAMSPEAALELLRNV